MSAESEDQTSGVGQVYRLLFIKRGPHSFSGADKYLQKRGFEVTTVTDVKNAAMKALELKPHLIFLAFDHSNAKVQTLPKIFGHLLPEAICIPFLETMSSFHHQKLRTLGFSYVLLPPITGPKIERKISQIIGEQGRSGEARRGNTGNEFVINIKQGFNPARGMFLAQSELDELKSQLSLSDLKKLMPRHHRHPDESDNQYRDRLLHHLQRMNNLTANTHANSAFFDDVYSRACEIAMEREDNSVDFQDLQKALQELSSLCPENLRRGRPQLDENGVDQKVMNQLLAHLNKNQLKINNVESQFSVKIESAVEKGSRETLQYLREKSTRESAEKVFSKTKHAVCFLVESPSYYGYLLVASAHDTHLDDNLKALIRQKLNEYLEASGEPVVLYDHDMDLKIQEVAFQEWAISEAEFLHKSITNDHEIAFAFFPVSQKERDSHVSEEIEDKISLEIDELITEIPVEFDIYMHLPNNKKFIKYTRAGLRFYPEQKKRLMGYGVKKMHLKQEDVTELRRYRAQNYLNNIIKNFKTKRQGA